MKITSLDKEMKKVFETGCYQIPRFQCPYSWEKDNVAEFWNDTIIDNEADYFIGSIVVYTKTDEIFGIVDGQQRLTTITMILCAIRDFYKREKFTSQALGVHSLIEKIDLDNEKSFVLQTETSYPYFQEHIQKFDEPDVEINFTPEEVSLKSAFEQITAYIEGLIKSIKNDNTINDERKRVEIQIKLNEIRDKLLKLKVIYIELDNEDDAYLIFETLNTRGKDLAVSDLVKNYLTKHLKAANKKVDITKDKWNAIRANVDVSGGADVDLDSFLLHFWLSKYDATTKKELFKKLKSTIKPSDTKDFLNNLLEDSVSYQSIFNPELKIWPKNENTIKNSLIALQGFKVVQQTPMVLSILRSYNNKQLRFSQTKELLESIEHFHYVFNAVTSQRSSGSVSSIFSTYARKLSGCKGDNEMGIIIREFRKKLRERVPTYEEFLINFKDMRFVNDFTKQKKIIHYTLSKIDKAFNVTGVDISYDTMTIEHLLAQKSAKRVPENDRHVGMIGNLVLLNEKTNGILGNKDFSQKKTTVLSSNIYLDKILKTSGSKWDSSDIESRTEELADLAYHKVFKI
jgi:uncharacterized protein with ParB-like and HNH nuclease domain